MLNNIFLGNRGSDYILGDKCHQQKQDDFPIWAVTDLTGKLIFPQPKGWAVTGGRITITRLFQASTAMITCTVPSLALDRLFPELPKGINRSIGNPAKWGIVNQNTIPVVLEDGTQMALEDGTPVMLDGPDYPLDKGDEIAIWCGYLRDYTALIPTNKETLYEDLDINFELVNAVNNAIINGDIIRRFVGVIDTISIIGSSTQGVNLIIQCRDRMKYLMDSVGTFNTTDFNPFVDSEGGADLDSEEKGVIKRSDVIIELARRCIGHLEFAASLSALKEVCGSVGGVRIKAGYIKNYTSTQTIEQATMHGVYTNINGDESGIGKTDINPPFIGGTTRTRLKGIPNPDLVMNIISGRLPYRLADKGGRLDLGTAGYHTITDRAPVEFIKFLALQEPWPTEFFCDSRTGEYWYAPRGLDKTGLIDPKRFFRTYFFRNAPANVLSEIKEANKAIVDSVVAQTINDGSVFTVSRANMLVYDPDWLETGETSLTQETYTVKILRTGPNDITVYASSIESKQFPDGLIYNMINEFFDASRTNRAGYNLWDKLLIGVAGEELIKQNKPVNKGNVTAWYQAKLAELDKKIADTRARFTLPDKLSATELGSEIDITTTNAIHTSQTAFFFREESSSINWRSNIIVSNQPVGADSSQAAVHLQIKPSWLNGRNYPVSYFNAVDQTIGNNQAELIAVAFSYARNYGKELRSASMHISGDPSLIPGELIQVLGSPLHPEVFTADKSEVLDPTKPDKETSIKEWIYERKKITEYIEGYDALHKNLLSKTTTNPEGNTPNTPQQQQKQSQPPSIKSNIEAIPNNVQPLSDTVTAPQAALLCPAFFGQKDDTPSTGGSIFDTATPNPTLSGLPALPEPDAPPADKNLNSITFPEDPKTMWRVEAVIDKFNEQPGSGYKTEVALLSPF